MNLSNIPSGKLQHRGLAVIGRVRLDQHGGAGGLGLGEGVGEIVHLITGHLAAVGERQDAVGHADRHLAERGFDADAAIAGIRLADLAARGADLIRHHLAMGEAREAAHECLGPVGRHIDAVLRHGLIGGIRRLGGVPVELHVDAAGPLDHGVAADRIGKCADDDIGARRARGLQRHVEIGDQITGALGAERIRDRCLEAEQRHSADGGLQQLRGGAARRRRHGGDHLRGALAAEGGEEARDETVDVLRRDIDVGGVVLRGDRDCWGGRGGAGLYGSGCAGEKGGCDNESIDETHVLNSGCVEAFEFVITGLVPVISLRRALRP